MKHSRRQELRKNDLSVWLQNAVDWINQNANYIIGIAGVVIAVMLISWYLRHQARTVEAAGWSEYYEIAEGQGVEEMEVLLRRASALADDFEDDRNLGPLALELQADLLYSEALDMIEPDKKSERLEQFKKAGDLYQTVISRYGRRTDVVARATMSLAAAKENLVVLGDGNKDEVRDLYQKVVDLPHTAFEPIAEERLKTLDDRLAKLEIVATQPAGAEITQTLDDMPSTTPASSTLGDEQAPSLLTAPPSEGEALDIPPLQLGSPESEKAESEADTPAPTEADRTVGDETESQTKTEPAQ
jgi:hypothetical protein